MDWFSQDEHDQRVSISTQGRNSTPVDLVIEQIERSQWINHGSTRSVTQKEKLAQKEEDLSERQGDALEEVRNYWKENYRGIDSKQLQEAYPDHFDTHKKALATLKQLETKGFLKSTKDALEGRGDVRLFQPSV
jgi:phosphoglycolate phosphatase-like HAD superfamily hydrolase